MAIQKLFTLLIIILMISVMPIKFSEAHGAVLLDVSLDFDSFFKEEVDNAAKEFLDTDKEPVFYDVENNIIMVSFDNFGNTLVYVNPYTFDINGFNDNSLRNKNGKEVFDYDLRKEIAEQKLDELPQNIKKELVFIEEEKVTDNVYRYRWNRFINEVYVSGEGFYVDVDSVKGNLIGYKLYYFYEDSNFDTTPTINGNVAKYIAEIMSGGKIVEGSKPVLVIRKNKLLWGIYVRMIVPFYVGIDAKTGEVGDNTADLLYGLPDAYNSDNVKVVKSEYIRKILGD